MAKSPGQQNQSRGRKISHIRARKDLIAIGIAVLIVCIMILIMSKASHPGVKKYFFMNEK
jgi:hypothetical protein